MVLVETEPGQNIGDRAGARAQTRSALFIKVRVEVPSRSRRFYPSMSREGGSSRWEETGAMQFTSLHVR